MLTIYSNRAQRPEGGQKEIIRDKVIHGMAAIPDRDETNENKLQIHSGEEGDPRNEQDQH